MITAAPFFCFIFPNTKIPGRTTWNLCVEMYITTKGIEKSKTKKKTVPGFGAISIDNFSFQASRSFPPVEFYYTF